MCSYVHSLPWSRTHNGYYVLALLARPGIPNSRSPCIKREREREGHTARLQAERGPLYHKTDPSEPTRYTGVTTAYHDDYLCCTTAPILDPVQHYTTTSSTLATHLALLNTTLRSQHFTQHQPYLWLPGPSQDTNFTSACLRFERQPHER